MPQQKKTRGGSGSIWRWMGGGLVAFWLLALSIQPVLGLAYRFSVPRSTADIYINEDGTATVEYTYVFDNDNNADPIDAVDIGTPTTSYDLDSVSGTIDGQPVESIERSPYIDPGVALNLGNNAIQPGATGEVRARIGTVRRILFKASTQEAEPYASFQFQPNYFGSEFVTGQTDMTVTLHLPPGLEPDEPRYFPPQNWSGPEEPESGIDDQNRVFYRWQADNASSSAQYTFGAAFPARIVPASALLTETPRLNFDWENLCPILFCLGFAGFIGMSIYGGIVGDRKRKLQYLPPRVAVEGNGIKRGLTAVEASILMEQPMDKILTMILFSVVKKGAARVVSRDPMKLEITQPVPEDLRSYETDFLAAMSNETPAAQRRELQDMMTNLIKGVSEKMRGFSRKETIAYYQDITNKAWQQVEQADTPEMKMQMFDDAMDWTMLDRRFDDRTRDVFGPRPVMMPTWWWRYDPTIGGGIPRGTTSGPSVSTGGNQPPQGVSLPSLPGSDIAASMVTGMQSFSGNVIGDLTAFTGGVTNKTNPVPKTTSTRSGGGGGRSCACACACAGCACACAGGGR
ncbi:MAG: hypothetical protein EHM21_00440 [Chloroflexi bacterium]|nr:MAG: hypothetical protein EHM21_00440 [Chloroflexota bacterium]